MPEPLSDENIYAYNPSLAAAALFTALNGIWVVWHAYLCFWLPRSRKYKHRYTIPLFVAATLSTAGYLVRCINVDDLSSIPLYATSASYIVIAPIFVCASLYLLLKYLVNLCLPKGRVQYLFGLSPRWLGRIFIASDVTSFLTQCAGSGIASSGNWEGNTKDIGVNILLVGLALQLATFTLYLAFLYRFMQIVRRQRDAQYDTNTKKVVLAIWIASAFVQTRTIFRLIEFALGIWGYPFSHEWCLYVLEAIPMWVALGLLAFYHPVSWLQQKPLSLERKEGGESLGSVEEGGGGGGAVEIKAPRAG